MSMNSNYHLVLGKKVDELRLPNVVTPEAWDEIYAMDTAWPGFPSEIRGFSDGEFATGLKVIGYPIIDEDGDHTNLQKLNTIGDILTDTEKHEEFERYFGVPPDILGFFSFT